MQLLKKPLFWILVGGHVGAAALAVFFTLWYARPDVFGASSQGLAPVLASVKPHDKGEAFFQLGDIRLSQASVYEDLAFMLRQTRGSDEGMSQILADARVRRQIADDVSGKWILFHEAEKSGLMKDKDLQRIVSAAVRDAVLSYYVTKTFSAEQLGVTDDEVAAAYQQYRSQLGPFTPEVDNYLRQQLKQKKMGDRVAAKVSDLRAKYGVALKELTAPAGSSAPAGLPGMGSPLIAPPGGVPVR